MSLAKTSVKHPTTVIILTIMLTALGIYSMKTLPLDMFPEMNIPYVLVSTTYANTAPSEVEQKVTKTLESSFSGISGLKKLQSTSSQGSSQIILEFEQNTDLTEAMNSIRDRIDLVRNYLPSDADSPIIMKLDPNMMPIMAVALTSDSLGPEELRTLAENVVSPRLEQIDGVASTSLVGGREKAILVEVPKEKLEAYGLSISTVGQMIAAQNVQSSIGSITERGIDWSITTDGQYASLDDIRNTVVTYKVGSDYSVHPVLLSEIATVREGYKPISSYAYVNGESAIVLYIQKQSGKNTVTTTNAVRKQYDTIRKAIPGKVTLFEAYNSSDIIEQSINQVSSSAIQGAILAILVLLFFLRNFKSTLIVALSIPISLVITLGAMYFSGLSLNLMTLAGLALGVGMLVDNSIVILENIFSYRERGTKAGIAAILGSQEMTSAIVSSTLTTICVFLPMLMYSNQLGMISEAFKGLAFTVVFALLISLVVALTLVPVLSSKYLKIGDMKDRNQKGFQKMMTRFFNACDNGYAKSVRWILHHKVLFLVLLALLLGFCVYQIPKIGFVYMPETEQNSTSITLTMPQGTTIDATNEVLERLNKRIEEEVRGIKMLVSAVGGGGSMMSSGGTNVASISITYHPSKERQEGWDNDVSAKPKLLAIFQEFPEAILTISTSSLTSSLGGGGIDIAVKSTDLDLCRSTSKEIERLLKEQASDSLLDITTSLNEGLPQVDIVFDRERMYLLGLNVASVNAELKTAIKGTTVSRYTENGTDTDIVLSLSEADKTNITDLDSIMVTNANGKKIPLSNFAHTVESRAPLSINREDQSRIIHVTAKIKDGYTVDKVEKQVEAIVGGNIPQSDDLLISYGGDYQQLQEGLQTFMQIIIIAILLVFSIMASQFESFKKPFIVFFTIPLSIIGIVLVYMATGQVFNLITAVGLLILVGIIVNNGIVLVDYTALLQNRGYTLEEACVESAKSRLRPILMTTLTTVLALVPMAFFPGEGSEMVQPIGQTVLGGLSFGTLMTLFLMPTLYYIFNRRKEKKDLQKKQKEAEELKNEKA